MARVIMAKWGEIIEIMESVYSAYYGMVVQSSKHSSVHPRLFMKNILQDLFRNDDDYDGK